MDIVDQLIMFVFACCLSSRFADAYDPVDPNGNIIINWDFQSIENVYTVMVSVHNHQLYRHIEQPGWRLSWRWAGNEIIWGMTGAEATEQGDCRRIRGATRPYCCEKQPVIVDLPPGTPYNNQVSNCCRGGVLSSLTQNNRTSTAAFQMVVGGFRRATYHDGDRGPALPSRFGVGVPGYSCSNATKVNATRSRIDRHRHVQALLTWQVTCTYSQFMEAVSPTCCVSLSSFYNSTIVPEGEKPELPAGDGEVVAPVFRCTDHMCPVRVHWHVKISYREYWRVKVTITNYNQVKNYSDWNLVVQHPNLRSLTQLFSFNYQPLIEYGTLNDTGMFWGIRYYNEMMLQDGNVQTEMILKKDKSNFTFSGGWAFPRRVYFDGHECVMPPPDQYPLLPNAGPDSRVSAAQRLTIATSCLLSLFIFLIV
uniref:COBRA-like protein n=1 Tax=Oryza punctata TaxID=4537 RepID=A0A0E0KTC3_ORYPU